MEKEQEVGGLSPHFSVDRLVNISGEEGCTVSMHYGSHCWEMQKHAVWCSG